MDPQMNSAYDNVVVYGEKLHQHTNHSVVIWIGTHALDSAFL